MSDSIPPTIIPPRDWEHETEKRLPAGRFLPLCLDQELLNRRPVLIRIVVRDGRGELKCVGASILFKPNAISAREWGAMVSGTCGHKKGAIGWGNCPWEMFNFWLENFTSYERRDF